MPWVQNAMDEFKCHRALELIWIFIGHVNRYVDVTQPWALAKDPAKRSVLDAVLHALGESLNVLGILLSPFLPEAAAENHATRRQTGPPRLPPALPTPTARMRKKRKPKQRKITRLQSSDARIPYA